jgi:probable phosphoglycerate mutase
MTVILLIRHGETDWVSKRLQSRLPGIDLNGTGKKQAQEVADALEALPIKAIYSSPIERAMQTAQPLADRKGLPVEIHPGLIEMDYGIFAGKTFKQLWRMNAWKKMVDPDNTEPFPGGDSIASANERVVNAIIDISSRWQEKDMVACFTHADQVRLTLAHYLQMPEGEFHKLEVNTCSVSIVKVWEDKALVLQMNQVLSKQGWMDYLLTMRR